MDYFDFLLKEVTEDNKSYYDLRARQCLTVFQKSKGRVPSRVLDIGAGAGALVNALRKSGVDAHGVELSINAVEHATQTYGPHYTAGDIGKLNASDVQRLGQFDLITSFEVFQMFPYFEMEHYFSQVRSLLRDDGVFLLMIPNFGHPYLFPYLAYSDPFTKTFFTPESLYRAAKNSLYFDVERIIRWNSGSRLSIVKIREFTQKIAEALLTRLTPFVFQSPKKLNKIVHEADIFLSSHLAAVLVKK